MNSSALGSSYGVIALIVPVSRSYDVRHYAGGVAERPELVESAAADAVRAAVHAGVRVEPVHTPEQSHDAAAVICVVWDVPPDGCIVDANTMVALAHSGNYVAAAYRGDEMVGTVLGWFSAELGRAPGQVFHSHIAGVVPGDAGRGVGLALKLDQRRWCLERGIDMVTWTTDPLVSRNAHFNIARLGVRVHDYRVNQYGTMRDGLNAGQQSDRILVSWDLAKPLGGIPAGDLPPGPLVLAVGADGMPVTGSAPGDIDPVCRLAVPRDIEAVHRANPMVHSTWRLAVRDVFVDLLGSGWQVIGFDGPAAQYVFERTP
jgi:predicted GNAT superfamily acetyltransferase